ALQPRQPVGGAVRAARAARADTAAGGCDEGLGRRAGAAREPPHRGLGGPVPGRGQGPRRRSRPCLAPLPGHLRADPRRPGAGRRRAARHRAGRDPAVSVPLLAVAAALAVSTAPASIDTTLGRTFVVRSTIVNPAPTPTRPLIAHLNVLSLGP